MTQHFRVFKTLHQVALPHTSHPVDLDRKYCIVTGKKPDLTDSRRHSTHVDTRIFTASRNAHAAQRELAAALALPQTCACQRMSMASYTHKDHTDTSLMYGTHISTAPLNIHAANITSGACGRPGTPSNARLSAHVDGQATPTNITHTLPSCTTPASAPRHATYMRQTSHGELAAALALPQTCACQRMSMGKLHPQRQTRPCILLLSQRQSGAQPPCSSAGGSYGVRMLASCCLMRRMV